MVIRCKGYPAIGIRLNKFIFSIVFLVNSLITFGQNNVLRLDQITTKDGLPQNSVQAILQDRYGFIWLSSFSGVYKFDGYEFIDYRPNPEDQHALISRGVYNLVTDSQQNIYVTFFDTTYVCRYNYDSDNFERILRYKLKDYVIQQITRKRKQAIKYFDTHDSHWEYSDNLLTRKKLVTGEINKYWIEAPQSLSMTNDAISCMFIDKHENLWLGTENQGMYKVNTNSKQFFAYYSNNSGKNYLVKDIIRAVAVDKSGNIWLGTFYNGIYIYNRINNTVSTIRHDRPNPGNSLVSDEIRSILCDSKGIVWIGTKRGLSRYNPQTGVYTNYDTVSVNRIPHNWVHSIMEDHLGVIWIGTFNGIARYDEQTGHFVTYSPNKLFTNNQVDALFEDSKHNIWVATQAGGVTCLIRKEDPLQFNPVYYINSKLDRNSISSNRAFSIAEDKNGYLWIATEYGLNRLEPKSGTFIHFNLKSGLPDEMIMGLLVDNNNNLWISHKKGLSLIDTKTFSIRNYTEQDGLQSNEFSENACFRNPVSGELFFGGNNGLNSFFPDKITDVSTIPEVVFTGLEVLNQNVYPNKEINGRVLIASPLLFTKKITLKYSDKSFSIKFSALHYANPKSNQYKYRLEGYNKDWIVTNAGVRFASYSNLPAGEYRFKVMASNNDGVWNPEPSILILNIRPPWWNNRIAYIVYFLIASFIFYLIYSYIVYKEKFKNQIKYEQMKTKKILELDEMKIQFFTNVSHEFRTPLSLIIDPLRKLKDGIVDHEKSKYYYSIIHQNAQSLLELVNQLLDFRKIEKGYFKLEYQQADIAAYARKVFDTFNLNAEQKNIKYGFYASPKSITARFDNEKIEKILNNLLSNAFKYTPDFGEISLEIYFEKPEIGDINPNGNVIIAISDSGSGISEREQKKIFERFYQIKTSGVFQNQGTGIGLAYTRQLVEILNGEISVESKLGQGSVFTVKIPVGEIDRKGTLESDIAYHKEKIKPSLTNEITGKAKNQQAIDEEMNLILIVEDNIDVRSYLKNELTSKFRVIEATNGSEGLKATLNQLPDIILSDIVMPEMSGLELCKFIKADERTSHIPIVLLTARQSDSFKKEGYEFGADAYITKPFNTSVLLARLENLIESRKSLKALFSKSPFVDVKKIAGNSADERFIENTISLIEDEMSNPEFNIDNLSDKLKMSRRHLTHKIKTLTGLTVLEFVTTVRLNKGARLLLTKDYSVSEISYMLGYNIPANFTRSFVKQFGKTPTEYVESQAG